MTQEEKDLLLRDLCARLPYQPICNIVAEDGTEIDDILTTSTIQNLDIWGVKPYLRPISTITEEEIYDFAGKLVGGLPHDIDVEERTCLVSCNYGYTDIDMEFCVDDMVSGQYGPEGYDLLLANHFDFRGLIPKELALSTDKFNPYKD